MYTHESYNCNASRNSPNRPVTHTTTLYKRRVSQAYVRLPQTHTHTQWHAAHTLETQVILDRSVVCVHV